jgi:hypothetical protein
MMNFHPGIVSPSGGPMSEARQRPWLMKAATLEEPMRGIDITEEVAALLAEARSPGSAVHDQAEKK